MGKIIKGKMDLSRRNQVSSFLRDCNKQLAEQDGEPILVLGVYNDNNKMQLAVMAPDKIKRNKLAMLYYLEQTMMAVQASLSDDEKEALMNARKDTQK